MRRDLITACSDINQHSNRSSISSSVDDDKTEPATLGSNSARSYDDPVNISDHQGRVPRRIILRLGGRMLHDGPFACSVGIN